MGTTYNPQAVLSGFQSTELLNDQFTLVAAELAKKVDRYGVAPNQMQFELDMNSHRILNVSQGVLGTDGVNLSQVQNVANSAIAAAGGFVNPSNSAPLTFNFGIATGSQGTVSNTTFNLTTLFGVTAFTGLTVIVNGVVQFPGLAYSVTAITTVVFSESLLADTDIMFIYGDLSPTPVLPNILAAAGVSYDLMTYIFTTATASQEVIRFKSPRVITWLANFSGSTGSSRVAATAQTDFDVKVNGVSKGTVRFAAAATSATFIAASPVTIAVNDIVTVIAPASPDGTLAGISIVLFGASGT